MQSLPTLQDNPGVCRWIQTKYTGLQGRLSNLLYCILSLLFWWTQRSFFGSQFLGVIAKSDFGF